MQYHDHVSSRAVLLDVVKVEALIAHSESKCQEISADWSVCITDLVRRPDFGCILYLLQSRLTRACFRSNVISSPTVRVKYA